MTDTLTSIAMATGLAGATGIRAGLPLFAAALVKYFQAPGASGTRLGLVLLAAVAILEVLFDKLPKGRLAELVLTPVRALAGGLVFVWLAAAVPTVIGLVVGTLFGVGVSLSRAAWRAFAVFVIGPYADSLASSVEDAVAAFLIVLSVLTPPLGLAVVLLVSARSVTRLVSERRAWPG